MTAIEGLRTGHLFAGIDGLGLGLEPHGFQPAWFSEYEAAPSRVLAHHYPHVPNHGDITAIDWRKVEPVDVLTGGFPCQDISKAGKGAGIKEGTRSGLWFEYVRAIRELRPRLVVVENVSALLTRGLDIVLGDLAACGFDADWTVLRASDVGAAHRRERLFIVAHVADGDRVGRLHGEVGVYAAEAGVDALRDAPAGGHEAPADAGGAGTGRDARGLPRASTEARRQGTDVRSARDGGAATPRDPDHTGLEGRDPLRGGGERAARSSGLVDWGEFAPAIRRWEHVLGRPAPAPTVDGRLSADFVEWHMGFPEGWTDILTRTERLKALGNAVVPQCADVIGRWALDLTRAKVAA
jgi:DNA (cytosine-5)-methyltransferase 1